MAEAFKKLTAEINKMIVSGQYSKSKAWDLITKTIGTQYRKGLIRVEDNCVVLSLVGPDGVNYLYWNCFEGNNIVEHQFISTSPKVEKSTKNKEKPKVSYLKHLQGAIKPTGGKMKFLDVDALPLPPPVHNRNIHYHFDPKNPIEEHARPANANITYTPIRHDFVETPDISNTLP